ncbi:hypothetical protein CVT25_007241, partial [Psilocybe cyanescens]
MKYPLAIVNRLLQEFGSDICLAYDIMCAFTVTLKKSILGEKYPLAIVNRLLQEFGSDICLAYDIMCAFTVTLKKSILGEKVRASCFCGVVPAFHGHAHNRGCQVQWHPLYVEGVGLEDFEECERTFCCSNELASVTRLATPYHRQQHIDEHFYFHDLDKHCASGNFIYENYRQALEKIQIDSPHLAQLLTQLKIGQEDYENYLKSERKYLAGLRMEPAEEQASAEYMEHLFDLSSLKQKSDDAAKAYKSRDCLMIVEGYTGAQITKINTQYRMKFQRWTAKNEEVLRYEEANDIPVHWAPTSPEYQAGLVVVRERKYRRALDELERLVVQRLFEIKKLGMSGVGYKLREKISKSLKTRADAIQSALKCYNEMASLMVPQWPALSWESVIAAVNLADFNLLQDSRQNVLNMDWAQPANCEGMVMYFQIKRAKEEIVRLNVEIRRLLTFLYDDHVDHYRAVQTNLFIKRAKEEIVCLNVEIRRLLTFLYDDHVDHYRAVQTNLFVNPSVAFEIPSHWQYRNKIHEAIIKRLVQTSQLS